MAITNDQYLALDRLLLWYRKYQHQFIEIAGIIGTGMWETIQEFIELSPLDPREVMYLSYDQKQVLELAYRGYHAYYLSSIIYNYRCQTDLKSLPVINHTSAGPQSVWRKEVRSRVDKRYKLIVVFDSTLLSLQTVKDLGKLNLPVIMLRDPMLVPSPDTYSYLREPNLQLREIAQAYVSSPIVYFAQKIIRGDKLDYGNYDNVSVVPRKQINLHNLRSSEMNITLGEELRRDINAIYREKILNHKGPENVVGERLIVMSPLYREMLKNADNKKVRLYLRRGLIGYLTKINKHAVGTRYVNCDFRPDGYHESFVDLMIDRYYLNGGVETKSRQERPDEILETEYAYALSAPLARISHWDKTTVIFDNAEVFDEELRTRLMYTAVSRAKKSMTIIT